MQNNIICEKLFSLQDKNYKEFSSKLIPTLSADSIIGVRTPALRKLAREVAYLPYTEEFLQALPHIYYEENNLHGFIICAVKDFDRCIEELERFLPYVDNWATCDSIRPVCFKKNTDRLPEKIDRWIKSEHIYTVRFAVEMLMTYFLDCEFDEKYLKAVSRIKSDEYYVNMMIAWYFATALAKQWDSAVLYIEKKRLPVWVHNKTIQKAIESYRIDDEKKQYLRKLKY